MRSTLIYACFFFVFVAVGITYNRTSSAGTMRSHPSGHTSPPSGSVHAIIPIKNGKIDELIYLPGAPF